MALYMGINMMNNDNLQAKVETKMSIREAKIRMYRRQIRAKSDIHYCGVGLLAGFEIFDIFLVILR